jgi:NAD(P)-dependent dehydrogenase (short-subunit alcohol dehydrogenase family)
MAGKTCVISGATSGIGRAAAIELAAMGANLVLVGRNADSGSRLVRRFNGAAKAARAEFLRADLSVQSEVRGLAATLLERYDRLDVLLNNAGARFDTYAESVDGIELTLATNHLSHFLLTSLLVPRLTAAPAARVITVASSAHYAAVPGAPWVLDAANFNRRLAYSQSKLANVMFAFELARRLASTAVASNAVDPGGVATNFARNNGMMSWTRHLIAHAIRRQLSTPRVGAEGLVYLSAAEEVTGTTGAYFRGRRLAQPSAASHDRVEGARLWALSERLTGIASLPAVEPVIV